MGEKTDVSWGAGGEMRDCGDRCQLHLDQRTAEHAMVHTMCSELRLEPCGLAAYRDQLEPCHRTERVRSILEKFLYTEVMGESGRDSSVRFGTIRK